MTTVERSFVGLPTPGLGRAGAGGHPCQGVYHAPTGSTPHTAFIASHYNIDFSEHYLADLLAGHGFGFLGWNTRFRGDELHHRDVSLAHGAENAPAYPVLTAAVSAGTRLAIWLSKKI